MVNFVNASSLSKSQAEKTALDCIAIVKEYLDGVNQISPALTIELAKGELEELEDRIRGKSNVLKTNAEVDAHFTPAINITINHFQDIKNNLQKFWNAHMDALEDSHNSGRQYNAMKYAMENKEKILEVDSRYREVVEQYKKNQDDKTTIYALFYVHILKTETLEHAFIKQFKEILSNFNIINNYDPEEIFSATQKYTKSNGWRTDARAIRDCLGHNLFKLDFNGRQFNKISFTATRQGLEFQEIFTRNEFIQFLNNTDLLYRGTMQLLFIITGLVLIKQHLLQPDLTT